MPPRVHLLLYRHANKAVLSAGLVAAAWYWPALAEKGIFLIFLPALFAYLLLPAALAWDFAPVVRFAMVRPGWRTCRGRRGSVSVFTAASVASMS